LHTHKYIKYKLALALTKLKRYTMKQRQFTATNTEVRSETHSQLSKEMTRLIKMIFPEGKSYTKGTKIDKAKSCANQLSILLQKVENSDLSKSEKDNLKTIIAIKIKYYKNLENEK